MTAPALPPPLQHYLLTGCWAAPAASLAETLEVFLLSGAVLRNDLDALARVWADIGLVLTPTHRGEPFAALALRVRDWRTWPASVGRLACREHPAVALPTGDAARRGRAVAVHPTNAKVGGDRG